MQLKPLLAGAAAGFGLGFALVPTSASAANLVINGGFESPAVASGGFSTFAGGSGLLGWSVAGSNVVLIDTAYTEGGLVFNPNGGTSSVDLTGVANTGPANALQQSIDTETGLYRLTFYVGNASPTGQNGAVYSLASTINLSINGGAVMAFTNGDNTPFRINWKRFDVDFAAIGPTTLTFSNGTPLGDNFAGLDDVSVTLRPASGVIPEPASWAMMIAGFGLVGGMMRRRGAAIA